MSDVKPRESSNCLRSDAHAVVSSRHHRARPPRPRAACACRATSPSPTATRSSRRWPRAVATSTNYAPGADCRSTLACLRAARRRHRRGDDGTVTVTGTRARRGSRSPAGAARRRQLRHDDAAAGGRAGRPAVHDAGWSATRRCRAGRCGASSSRSSGWARGSRRPTATPPLTIHGARAARHCTPRRDVPSAQVKSAVLLAGLHAEGDDHASPSRRRRAITPSGRSRRSADASTRRRARPCRSPAASASSGQHADRARRLLVRRVLDGRRPRRCPGSRGRDRGRRPQPDAHGAARRPAALRRARRGRASTATDGRRAARHDRRRGRPHRPPSRSRRRRCPASSTSCRPSRRSRRHGGEVTVRGAAELRVKESDRIAALVAGFRALGIDADERPDGFVVRARRRRDRPPGGVADARGDHRMAMAFAIAALGGTAPSHDRRRRRRRRSPIRASSTTLDAARAREGRQGLPRRLHGRRQDDAWRARWPGGSAGGPSDIDELIEQREHQTVADIFAQPRRAATSARPSARCSSEQLGVAPRWSSRPAAARSSIRRTARSINADGVSVWLDVPLERLIARVPADGRRPLAADRAGVRTALSSARRDGVRAGARPARRRSRPRVDALVEQLDRPAGCVATDALSRPDRHSRQPRGARRPASPTPTRRGYDETLVLGDLVGYGADPNAVVDRVRALAAGAPSSAATTTRSRAGSSRPRASTPSPGAPRSGRSTSLTPAHRDWLARAARGADAGRRRRRDLPRLAVRRGRLHLRRARRACARSRRRRGRSACSATRTTRSTFELADESFDSARRRDRARNARSTLQRRRRSIWSIPGSVGQPRDGDPRAAYAIVDTERTARGAVSGDVSGRRRRRRR